MSSVLSYLYSQICYLVGKSNTVRLPNTLVGLQLMQCDAPLPGGYYRSVRSFFKTRA